MADTGFIIAGSGESVDTDSQPWSNPGNITADDASTATSTAFGNATDSLKAYNFGFDIPFGSTIDGIEVRSQLSDNASSDEQYSFVNIGIDDSTLGTSKTPNVDLTTTPTNYDEGGSSDLWGLSITADDVNSSNFQARIKCSSSFGGFLCDAIWMKVYYTPPVGRNQAFIVG